jgi:tRNA pseudouridine38-40 synthase
VHFDLPSYWHDLKKLRTHLNAKLISVKIRNIIPVHPTFHARYDAKYRLYRYIFTTRPLSVFEQPYIARFDEYDEDILRQALKNFEGTHDFKAFHKSGSQPHTTLRTIFRARYYRIKDLGVITFLGNAFLRSQVRFMTEAAMRCASGQLSFEALNEQLRNEKIYVRKPAPPSGLYLARVYY